MMMVQFMGRFQTKKMFARGFPHILYLLEDLKTFMGHFMPELSNYMEGENVLICKTNNILRH